MTFKLFPSIAAAARSLPTPCCACATCSSPLERTGQPFDAGAHALGGSYLGPLAGLDTVNR